MLNHFVYYSLNIKNLFHLKRNFDGLSDDPAQIEYLLVL